MGSQQIVLIILSVIIVGIAVTTGLSIFNKHTIASNREACLQDMNRFAASAKAWWQIPVAQGGGGGMEYLSGGGGNWTNYIDLLGNYLGYNYNTESNTLQTVNGSYKILYGGKNSVKFQATGNEYYKGNPIKIDFIYNLAVDTLSIETINESTVKSPFSKLGDNLCSYFIFFLFRIL